MSGNLNKNLYVNNSTINVYNINEKVRVCYITHIFLNRYKKNV